MQLRAIDQENRLTFANKAQKQTDYFCLECQSTVRLRGGIHRQNHFYHTTPNRACRLSEKSMEHIQVQCYMKNLLPPEEAHLEYRFPSINRIADVVWLPQKMVFEVQCSGITMQEVQQRNEDYKKLGLQVIWILHDQRFNQWRITAAESYLRCHPFYFTNMDAEGNGNIYDQFDFHHRGLREKKLQSLPVNLAMPKQIKITRGFASLPKFVKSREEHWPFCFEGDLLSQLEMENAEIQAYLNEALKIEELYEPIKEKYSLKTFWQNVFVEPYFFVFKILLERACK